MKKILVLLLSLAAVLKVQAQFESGKKYVGASLSGFGLSYSSNEDFRLGLDAEAGYFITDGLLLKGNIGYDHTKAIDDLRIGASLRYLFIQNGIFLGAGAEYNHFTPKNNEMMIPLEVGYCFFINRHLTIEPSLYYKMSLHDFSGNSTVGVRVGLGFIF